MSPRLLASLFYLLYYAAAGSLAPYLVLFYDQMGMSHLQIGVLAAVPYLATLLGAPLWAGLADALRLHKYLLPLAMLGTLPPVLLILKNRDFLTLTLLVIVYAFMYAPVIPLADNAALEMLGEANRADYGRLRIWGAIGFGLAAWGAGEWIETGGMGIAFALYLVLMGCAAVITLRFPAPRRATATHFWMGARSLSSNPRWMAFLMAVFAIGVGFSILNNYFILYLTGLGAREGLFGLSVAAAGLSELPIYFFSATLIRRLKPQGLLIASFAAFGARSLAYSLIRDPRLAIAAQLLHGPTFSALWTGGVLYASQIAPPGLGASAQAAFGVTLFGLAGGVGALLGATLYDSVGPVIMFQIAAGFSLIALCIFSLPLRQAAAPADVV